MKKANPRILIAVCTTGRESKILELLSQLDNQIQRTVSSVRVQIFLNSDTCPEYLKIFNPILNPRIGYASIRNTALSNRIAGESIIFLDDDSTISPDWLFQLLSTVNQNEEKMIKGRIRYVREAGEASKHFKSMKGRHRQMKFAGAANLLLPARLLDRIPVEFDLKFDLGGEDTELTHRLTNLGVKIFYRSELIAYEHVSASKDTAVEFNRRYLQSAKIYNRIIAIHGGNTQIWLRQLKLRLRRIGKLLKVWKINSMWGEYKAITEIILDFDLIIKGHHSELQQIKKFPD